MCMQCVAQGAPFLGAALTVLNRRNLTSWATKTRRRAQRSAGEAGPAVADAPPSSPGAEPAGDVLTHA